MGNFEMPLSLRIERFSGVNAFLYDGELENMPYNCPVDLETKTVLNLSASCPGSFVFRYINNNNVHGCDGNESDNISFSPGSSELNFPGGQFEPGYAESCWDGGRITFGEIRYYWLDTTGNPADYPGLDLTGGEAGYLGIAKALVISRIRQVRVFILGCTPKAFVSIRGIPPTNLHNFRRPAIANVPGAYVDDFHRRILLESTATVRNMSLGLYNEGIR
ncbi:MAG: hypothetical protein MUP70_11340 [Candidatus Aminicenantes bacterium]|nr:hypothetical protein [Candidatus Aminicenantes bacterium]